MDRTIAMGFEFVPEDRPLLQFSGPEATIDARQCVLTLRRGTAGYPAAVEPFVRAQTFTAQAARQWVGLQVECATPEEWTGAGTTGIRMRLNDGTRDLWWNGTAWAAVTSSATQWNTIADVQSHLATFPVPTIRPVFALATADAGYSPTVRRWAVAFVGDVPDLFEEVFNRTLIAAIENVVVPLDGEAEGNGTTSIDLSAIVAGEEPIDVAGVPAAYRKDTDPHCRVDLAASYAPTTRLLTLTTAVPVGKAILIRTPARVAVSIATGADYSEIPTLPAIEIGDMAENLGGGSVAFEEFVNRGTLAGFALKSPRASSITFAARCMASRETEAGRLAGAVIDLVTRTPVIQCASVGVPITWRVRGEATTSINAGGNHVQEIRVPIRARSILRWAEAPIPGYAVGVLNVNAEKV